MLSQLNQLVEYSRVHGCRNANKVAAASDSERPNTLYYKAEIYRYFQCDFLKGAGAEAKAMLDGFETQDKFTTIEDYYFMYLMAKNLEAYGQQKSTAFNTAFKDVCQNELKKFDTRTLSIAKFDHNGDKLPNEGLTLEGLMLTEILSYLLSFES